MPKRRITWQMILMVCIAGLSVTNMMVVTKVALDLERLQSFQHRRESLPCQAIPIRFVMKEPECANKLLMSMNVTNTRILRDAKLSSQWDAGTRSNSS